MIGLVQRKCTPKGLRIVTDITQTFYQPANTDQNGDLLTRGVNDCQIRKPWCLPCSHSIRHHPATFPSSSLIYLSEGYLSNIVKFIQEVSRPNVSLFHFPGCLFHLSISLLASRYTINLSLMALDYLHFYSTSYLHFSFNFCLQSYFLYAFKNN